MPSPDDRRYLESHEWHKPEGDLITIGLSQFAVDELADVTYVEFTQAEGAIKAGESFGEIESVKATSDLYCGVDGTIVETNQQVIDNPALVNEDPFGSGWLIRVKPDAADAVEKLMAAEDYDKQAEG
ncbi:glycine cleavage system protein GcvH [Mucisphaera calidilacus]|uniref:Glycine cleavage system H protein n=1 Tax=Mucisphaera calidilacus TaxID=2527982 RepID=A0A518BZC2_9BACT|nr:glycine cleavage system protein GcvH [Mucisphaera calidilacus]QDU72314.1 Glycine cleavage system H protein [Mucisphaera calidilacus]